MLYHVTRRMYMYNVKRETILVMLTSVLLVSGFASEKFEKKIDKVIQNVYYKTSGGAKPWISRELFVDDHAVFLVSLSDSQWKKKLSDEEYYVLRKTGTEKPRSGEYNNFHEKGIYYSVATGEPLFFSEDKYDSKTGWPSFSKPINRENVRYRLDDKLFGVRIEVVDSISGSHLGHVFEDGPYPTNLRYCMNSVALLFVPEGEMPPPILQ